MDQEGLEEWEECKLQNRLQEGNPVEILNSWLWEIYLQRLKY